MAGTSLGYPHENVVQGGAVDGQLMDGQIRGQALHKLQGLHSFPEDIAVAALVQFLGLLI